MTKNEHVAVPSALFVALGLLLGATSARAENDALGAALSSLHEPVAAGRMQPALTALADVKQRLEQARVKALVHVLPVPPRGWKIVEDAWACPDVLRGSRTYAGQGGESIVLRLTENDPGKEIIDVVEKLLDPEHLDRGRGRVVTVGGRRALFAFESWEGGSRGVVRWALPKPDKSRMHGALALLTLETGGLSRIDTLAEASKVDTAAIQARLGDQPSDDEVRSADRAHLLANATQSFAEGRLGRALAWTRSLEKHLASSRARHLQTVLPDEPAGWHYDSGGLGGWPAGVSKCFRHAQGARVYVGVSEEEQGTIRAVAARLADPATLRPGESIAELGGRKALLEHDAQQSMFLLRVPVANGSALAWVRSWDAPDRAAIDLFAGLLDLQAIESALRR